MNITALGRTEILYNTIQAAHEAGHEIDRIITCAAEDFYGVSETDFERLAAELNVPFYCRQDINDPGFVATLADSPSDVAVSVNWKFPIRHQALNAFEHGVLNGHAGDLPKYRGNAAPNWAILNGEDEVVLTVHRMSEEIDAGPILTQAAVPITDDTYLADVYEEMRTVFPELFVESLNGLESGKITPQPQPDDPAESLRGYPRIQKDSEIDWTESATEIQRLIRASAEPLFGAYTYIGTDKLRVWRARTESPPFEYCGTPGQVADRRTDDEEVAVITGEGFLVLETVQLEDGERTAPTDAITTIRTRLGMDKEAEIRRLTNQVTALKETLEDE